uniref:Cytochrome P450 n=1 Tax=Acrobeloides nanus TaxID=290746 RepID=A0A914E7V6_9BILA
MVDRQMVLFDHPTVKMMKSRFHFFGKLPYFKNFYNEVKYNRDELYKFYYKHVQEEKAKIDFSSSADPTNFCEAYLREIEKMNQQGGEHYFTEEQLIGVVSGMWMAGQETTTTTLVFAVLFMMLYPEVQKKIQEEIDRVIGSDRFITMEDKPSLHYISATCQLVSSTEGPKDPDTSEDPQKSFMDTLEIH